MMTLMGSKLAGVRSSEPGVSNQETAFTSNTRYLLWVVVGIGRGGSDNTLLLGASGQKLCVWGDALHGTLHPHPFAVKHCSHTVPPSPAHLPAPFSWSAGIFSRNLGSEPGLVSVRAPSAWNTTRSKRVPEPSSVPAGSFSRVTVYE